MSFKLLRQVITHLRQKSNCPQCNSKFSEDSFFILATSMISDTVCNGLFLIVCPKCQTQAFMVAEVTSVMKGKKGDIVVETKATGPKVTVNEILDMHNFLKNWEGDVKELFR